MRSTYTSIISILGAFALGTLAACGDDGGMNQDAGSNENRAPCYNNGQIFYGYQTCSGTNLDGMTCELLGYQGGSLACNAGCYFNLIGCIGAQVCGNGVADPDEICDGTDLKGLTCQTLSGSSDVGGTLHCDGFCDYLLSYCEAGPLCGNGVLDPGESCDEGSLNSDTEMNRCRTNCLWASCGDGVIDLESFIGFPETCDDGLDNSNTRPDACRWDCQPAWCGDGVKDSPEECDGVDLGEATCATLGFESGTLTCDASCLLSTYWCN